MAEFPALPLWTDAYLADCGHLSDQEHGIYFQLLMHIWRSPECRIPNDDEWLARRLRRSVEEIRRGVRPIISEFCKTDGNWVWQGRLRKEWDWCRNKAQKNSDAAKTRWGNEKRPSERNTPTPTPTLIPTPTPSATQHRTGQHHPLFGEVRKHCENLLADPRCLVWGRVDVWLQSGADPDLDIYPTLTRLRANWSGTNLSYFDGAIADAIKNRTAPLPEGQRKSSVFNPVEAAKRVSS